MALRPVLTFTGMLAAAALLGALQILPPVVVVLSLPFLVILAWKPILRRLAIRNAVRRPRETALVLIGSLLGTAIITGSLIVGDTLHSSIRHPSLQQSFPLFHKNLLHSCSMEYSCRSTVDNRGCVLRSISRTKCLMIIQFCFDTFWN